MDRLIYTAMTGAKHVFNQQAGVANNLANVSTDGFRAQYHQFRAVPVQGPGLPTRAMVVDASVRDDMTPGAINHTARPLDVALAGAGWLAVEGRDGNEAYTRAGGLMLSPEGVLQTRGGLNVVGDGGPITVPPGNKVTIAADGTISLVSENGDQAVAVLGRLKLVNPPESELTRGADGLFRQRSGEPAQADETVRLVSGAVEGSNVNPVDAMVSLISLARQFEMQVKLLQTADGNARQAGQLLTMNR